MFLEVLIKMCMYIIRRLDPRALIRMICPFNSDRITNTGCTKIVECSHSLFGCVRQQTNKDTTSVNLQVHLLLRLVMELGYQKCKIKVNETKPSHITFTFKGNCELYQNIKT